MPSTVIVADDVPEYRTNRPLHLAMAPGTMTIVGEAGDAEEALALVLSEQPDIVITDLLMPRLNDIELVRRIKEELPGTKVIVMTSYTEDTYRRLAFVGGADASSARMYWRATCSRRSGRSSRCGRDQLRVPSGDPAPAGLLAYTRSKCPSPFHSIQNTAGLWLQPEAS